MKYIGRFNLLAIRLTEIGKDPTSKEWWKINKLYQRYCLFVDSYFCYWHCSKATKNKTPKVTRDPIKSPIRYIQYKLFFPLVIFIFVSTFFSLGNIVGEIKDGIALDYLWPECIFLPFVFLFFNLAFIIWAIIFILRLQTDFNKVLSAIKPLFPNDVYEDFVNLAKNSIKNFDYGPSSWSVNRIKRVDKNDKWR